MGGTLLNIYSNIGFALNQHAETITRLQEQISTGSRINRASDDPSAAYRVLGLNSEKRLLENYIDNMQQASDTLEISYGIIDEIKSAVSNEKVHLTQIVSDTYSALGKEQLIEEVNDVLEQVFALANTRHTNQYLFGGDDTNSAPYVAERSNGEITSVTYEGNSDSRSVEVASGLETKVFFVGEDIFCLDSRDDPVFFGDDTGAAAGTSTSSVRGYVWLTVTYNDTSGKYELSIDGGASTVAVEGDTSNLAVTDSQTGRVLYVDGSNITATGTNVVSVPGTYDIFDTLISLRDTMRNESDFSSDIVGQLISDSISALSELEDLLVAKSTSAASKVGFLESLKNTLDNIKFGTEDETANLQQADVTQIALDISRSEILYQMSVSVASKLMSLSLLDFIE
jgi:flagellar hook-associated protein 3 FlgL